MSFSHHFHRHHYAAPYAQPINTSYYTPAPYVQPMTAPSPYINAQGVSIAPPGQSYYDPMNSPVVVPPQYNENSSPYGYDHRFSGIKSHLKNRLSQKYHVYSDVPYPQQGYDAASFPQQQYDASGYMNNRDNQHAPKQNFNIQTQLPSAPMELPREYIASNSPRNFAAPAFGSPSCTAPIVPGTPPTISTPVRPAQDYAPLPNGRPRSLPPLPPTRPVTPTTSSPSVATTTPDRPRQLNRSNSSNRLSGSHNSSSSPRRSSDASNATNTSNVVAAIPTNMAHEERRQLAINLLSEIDAYERMQNRVFLFRLLPPLRFRVTVVRNVDGVPQQTETMMTMAELRTQLQHALEHDSQMVEQLGMTYENLVGLTRVQLGVKDVNMFPTFTYTNDCHIPAEKATCSVCLSDFQEGDNLKTVPCMHLFHTECIDEWLKMSKVCPVCKTCVEDENSIPADDDDCHKVKRSAVTPSP